MKINYHRPLKIKQYLKQCYFIDCPTRFTIVEATTKAGKTVGCIVWIFEQALQGKDGDNYWWVAPTFAVAKIAFRRMKRYIQPKELYKANEAELSITLTTGAVIFFKSGQDSDMLYGEDVKAVVIDEASRIKEASWFAIFSTLTATNGKCKIIGNVKGIDNWSYGLARQAEKGDKQNWTYFKLTAADAVEAGVLSQDVIDEAERTLPRPIFLELYFAIPFVNAANKFAYAFDTAKHLRPTKYNPLHPLTLSFDFNKNPITCTAFQHYDGRIRVIKAIKLLNSDIYALCRHIKTLWPTALFVINGDATGQNTSALVQDNLNYYTVIRSELRLTQQQFKDIPTVNPRIQDNQVLVNAILEHYPIDIDPTECSGLVYDLQFVEMLPDGTMKKGDRNDPKQQADSLDTFRYYLNSNFKWFLKNHKLR